MRKAIDQDTLEALISTGAMREFRVVRHHGPCTQQTRASAALGIYL